MGIVLAVFGEGIIERIFIEKSPETTERVIELTGKYDSIGGKSFIRNAQKDPLFIKEFIHLLINK